jgi:CRP-like cAMP-binding protein
VDTLTTPEIQVEQFIQNGRNDKAVELLVKLALACARKGDIARSEGFRDRIYELDEMALMHIVKVNEAIEAQKDKLFTPDYRRQWAPIFEKLSAEEARAFFGALKTLDIESEHVVLEQGRPNDRLFLVNHGQLKVVYADQDKDLLVNTLGSRDIFGQETFFSINVSTVTVKTISPVHLSYMDRATLERLKGRGNLSEDNLKRACRTGLSLPERLRQKGLDRRSGKRIQLNLKISFQLLSSSRKAGMSRAITAELWDISTSGLSFYFGSKNRETVRSLIGHTIGVRFTVTIDGQPKTVAVTGIVHGVESHPLDEYSVHLKLKRHFSDAALKAIQQSAS